MDCPTLIEGVAEDLRSAHVRWTRGCGLQLTPLALAVAFTVSCGSLSTTVPPESSDVITKSEIEATGRTNAVDVVRELRPRWLARLKRRQCVIAYRDRQRIIHYQSEWTELVVSVADVYAIRHYRQGRPGPTGSIGESDCSYIQFLTSRG
jgi:hypothetical protein